MPDATRMNGLRLAIQVIGLYFSCLIAASFWMTTEDLDAGRFKLISAPITLNGQPHHCLFCGLTHSFCALSHGHFRQAFSYHPCGPILYALFVFLAAWSAVSLGSDRWKRYTASLRRYAVVE